MANGSPLPVSVVSSFASEVGGTVSPLTTKGDLYGYGAANDRLPVGTDGYHLEADSTQSLGLRWLATAALPYVLAPAPSGGDDLAALQALVTTYSPLSVEVVLRAGVYLLSGELQSLTGSPLRMRGAGHNYTGSGGTVLQLSGAARSPLAVLAPYSVITDMKLDANQNGTYGIYLNASSVGRFTNVYVTNAKKDGWFLEIDTGTKFNDTSIIDGCWSVANGTVRITSGIASQHSGQRTSAIAGTATVAASNPTITIAGGPDLTTIGLRKGDWIRTGSGAKNAASTFAGQIASWTSTTIVLSGAVPNLPNATQAGSGLDYAIGIGDGWREVISSNNNLNIIRGGIWRGNAGAAFSFHGLFGPTLIGTQADANGFCAYSIGDADNVNLLRRISMIHPYSESDNGYGDCFLGDATGVVITSPEFGVGSNLAGSASGTVLTTGCIVDGDTVTSLGSGTPQNILFEIKNNAGTLQHRIVGDHWDGFNPPIAAKVVGANAAYANTPSLDSTHDFTNGAGIVAASAYSILFKVAAAQSQTVAGMASIEFNSTGTVYYVSVTTDAVNVNGTTISYRPAIYLTDGSGALVNFDTTAIPAGKILGIRISMFIK